MIDAVPPVEVPPPEPDDNGSRTQRPDADPRLGLDECAVKQGQSRREPQQPEANVQVPSHDQVRVSAVGDGHGVHVDCDPYECRETGCQPQDETVDLQAGPC